MKEFAKAPKKAPAASSTVQALKKKYQEQRLTSKTRSGVLNKLAQKGEIFSIKKPLGSYALLICSQGQKPAEGENCCSS
jgi:hypothetical protein